MRFVVLPGLLLIATPAFAAPGAASTRADKQTGVSFSTEAGQRFGPFACPRGARLELSRGQESFEAKCFDAKDRLVGPYVSRNYSKPIGTEGQYENGRAVGAWTLEFGPGKQLELACPPGTHAELETRSVRNHMLCKSLSDDSSDGPYVAWNSVGDVIERGSHHLGRKHGTWAEWGPNGKKRSEQEYAHGKLHGESLSWHHNGQPASRHEFVVGRRVGVWIDWYDNGQAAEQVEYRDGLLVGLYESWYPDGQLKQRVEYARGKKHGKANRWYANGRLRQQGFHEGGRPTGSWMSWHENGERRVTGQYYEGERDGTWLALDEQGRPWARAEFEQGVLVQGARWLDGKLLACPGNSRLSFEANFPVRSRCLDGNGDSHGVAIDRSDSGRVLELQTYRHGKLHGRARSWWPNGQLSDEGEYRQGKKVGVWVSRSVDGSATERMTYGRDGRLTKSAKKTF